MTGQLFMEHYQVGPGLDHAHQHHDYGIHLPPHQIERLFDILTRILNNKKQTSVKNWHLILGGI